MSFTDRTHYLRDARLAKVYAEGAVANRAGALITTNPWDGTGVPEEAAWDQGWNDANSPAGAKTDYDMSGHAATAGLAGKPAPELDAIS